MATQFVQRSSEEKSLGSGKEGGTALVNTITAGEDQLASSDFGDVDVKKLDRKIDWTILPFLCFLYLLSFLDRTAIGNARLFSMERELGMNPTSLQYRYAVMLFFFPYALFELPSNVLLKRLSPPFWFCFACTLVGVCMMAQGLVNNYHGLLAMRFLLGVFEAALFPGCQYLMSGWYTKEKFGLRSAIFFASAAASGSFGGLLSAGLSQIRGGAFSGATDGWRWIFIVIGVITIVSGLLSIKCVPNFPDKAKWLSEKERAFVINRLAAGQAHSAAGESFSWRNVWKGALDTKTWLGMGIYAGCLGPLYAFSVFTPTIIRTLGTWTAIEANLLSVPVYVVAAGITVVVGFFADKYGNHRALINMCCFGTAAVGYIILIAVDPRVNPSVCYFAVYLAAAGIYPTIPNTVALCGLHIEGTYKRSVVMAMFIGFGNMNGAASAHIYLPQEAPRYPTGHGTLLGYLAIGISFSALYWLRVRRENAAKDAGKYNETILDHLPHDEAVAEAQRCRDQELAEIRANGGLFGFWKVIQKQIHETPGGTYASVAEARRLKGDNYSGHRYSY